MNALRTHPPDPVTHGLATALDRDEFVLHWQPIVSVASSKQVGLEALVRWNRKGLALLSPAEFLPCAEATGLIEDLDRWVLREACRSAASWSTQSEIAGRIAINACAASFQRPAYARLVAEVLAETGLFAGRLEIELTERTVVSDMDSARAGTAALQALGCGVVLDDFGVGYASLDYLRQLPFNKIKVDRSLTDNLATDGRSNAIIEAVVGLAHTLGMPVCVEGIETDAQLHRLRDMGCDEAQGFLFGRPGPRGQAAHRDG